MKRRTEKQIAATKRNHEIMRLKGIMAHRNISFFTKEESKHIYDLCEKVCIRHGISYYGSEKNLKQQEIDFKKYQDEKYNNNLLDVKC